MFGRRFEKELALVDEALKNESGELALRKYLQPFVDAEIDSSMKVQDIDESLRPEIKLVAWKYLGLALNKYKGRADLMLEGKNDVHYFSTYYVWYVRQAILEYLYEKKA